MHDVLYQSIKSNIFVDQHAFMKKRPATTNLVSYESVSTLINNMEKGKQIDAVYVDFVTALIRCRMFLQYQKNWTSIG